MRGAAALLALVAMLALAPTATAAEGERVFDPELSLIGGCKEETLDPVEDPGCPTTPPVGPHPPAKFADPRAVATDFYGNIYVSTFGNGGQIDIFDPNGFFIGEIEPPYAPMSLALDSKGNLYVLAENTALDKRQVLHYLPDAPPEAGNVKYTSPPVPVGASASLFVGLAINVDNDHLFANFGGTAVEFNSAEEGNEEVRGTLAEGGCCGVGIAVDATRDRLYVSAEGINRRIDIYDLNSVVGAPPNDEYEKIDAIEGSAVPGGKLGNLLSVAVDEGNGHVFVLDNENTNLYEFDEDGNYLTRIEFPFQKTDGGEIGVDNGPSSPNGALSSEGRYLYVPSHRLGTGHSFAFKESIVGPPEVKSASAANISETEAELRSQINPKNLPTTYTFEYITEQAFEENEEKAEPGFTGATLAGQGEIPAGNLDVKVTAAATGLKAGTSYRFLVFAENEEGSDEAEGSFATYPSPPLEPTPCPNALLRIGPSALLPDCRAYELVTPPDTNARAPIGTGRVALNTFTNRQVSPAGDKTPFRVEGGSLPGFDDTTGSRFGDPYLSTRTATGWTTTHIGPSGAEATVVGPGTTSPDQGYSFWYGEAAGSLVLEGEVTSYVRYPDGHSELLGKGSLVGIEPEVRGELISEGGGHIIFVTGAQGNPAVQLEPDAAPDGTRAIYDRVLNPETGKRENKVVSLKPSGDPFGEGEDAFFQGASLDGKGVAFKVGSTFYLRYENEETFKIGEGIEFAGVAEGGRRVFYVEGGDLKAFDTTEGEILFADTAAPVIPVFVAAEGSAAYFVSETAIAGSGPNPNDDEAQSNEQNLYLSEEGQISFVGVVTDRDVEGEFISGVGTIDGLGLWVPAAGPSFPGRFGVVHARATPDGSVLLFKSRAALADYDPEGHAQIYRYDSLAGELECLSCNPTGAPASTDATLQSEKREGEPLFSTLVWIENLRADGARAFFESSEPLVAGDTDELQDVYEWEVEGVGSCVPPAPQGCLYLISSGQSLSDEYLWAVSKSGNDVFFLSSDLILGVDADTTASIYDARVGGGFPEPVKSICQGEGCRPQQVPAPAPAAVQTLAGSTAGNFKTKRCTKGKRKVKRGGKVICVKKKKQRRRKGGRR